MRSLTDWNPTTKMQNVIRDFDRFFDTDFFNGSYTPLSPWQPAINWELSLDMTEDDEDYIVTATVPGINPDDVDVTISNNLLTIRGEVKADDTFRRHQYYVRERQYGSFMRTITLPSPVKEDGIEATIHNGVLSVRLPKVRASSSYRVRIQQNKEGGYHGIVEKLKKVLPKPKLPKFTKSS